jgi:hypothetical protein
MEIFKLVILILPLVLVYIWGQKRFNREKNEYKLYVASLSNDRLVSIFAQHVKQMGGYKIGGAHKRDNMKHRCLFEELGKRGIRGH